MWAVLRREIARILAARRRGRIDKVIVWTLNEEERLRELAGLRVDGILTDDPAPLRGILERE